MISDCKHQRGDVIEFVESKGYALAICDFCNTTTTLEVY